ncbi:MAG TPA: acyl-CoA dehydrogenase family protein [Acidimicrobiales bacterium]|jgi:alkylation response protein AidB-like acyl-CoA dehydrogenase|nr:acyl-CoA dehydrogenase family protein [Acidimicrobiales bacterium]
MTEPAAIARDLAGVFAPRAAGHDLDASFPVADFEDLRAAGLLGLMVPCDLGGMGATFLTYAHVARELAGGNSATALAFNMHASVTGALASTPDDLARALGATDGYYAARDDVLRRAAEGALYQVAMSEAGAGSRFSQMTTTYEPEADGWRIRGRKTFCTGAGHADAYLVVARSPDGAHISLFLVPTTDGIVVEQTWDSLGMRATASNDLLLDVHAPHDALLGGIEGLAPLLAQTMPQWLVASYAAVYVGVAQAAFAAACEDLAARSLASLPAVRARLGRADADVHAAWLAACEAARRIDHAPGTIETNRWVYRAKLLAGDTAMRVAASMIEACGTSATRRGHPLERHFRDARCGALQPATSDVCADWLGAAAAGSDPDRDALVPRW